MDWYPTTRYGAEKRPREVERDLSVTKSGLVVAAFEGTKNLQGIDWMMPVTHNRTCCKP